MTISDDDAKFIASILEDDLSKMEDAMKGAAQVMVASGLSKSDALRVIQQNKEAYDRRKSDLEKCLSILGVT